MKNRRQHRRRGSVSIEVVIVAAVTVPIAALLFAMLLKVAPYLYALISGFVNSPYL